jgi:MraZ protein
MLIGEYKHTIDEKKRISLPSKFRKIVGKKIIITRGLDKCLFIYPIKEWNDISKKIGELGMGQSDRRAFNRFILDSVSKQS